MTTEKNENLPALSPEKAKQEIGALHGDDLLTSEMVDALEKQVALRDRLKVICLRFTRESDWVDEQGEPYLQATGAEKVASGIGIKIGSMETVERRERDDRGDYIEFIFKGTAEIHKGNFEHSIEVFGKSWTRDKFLGTKFGKILPLSEVDIPAIRQKGYTNFLNNAIKRLLGIRGITWDDLKTAGLSVERIKAGKKVSYKTDKKPEAPKPQTPTPAKPPADLPELTEEERKQWEEEKQRQKDRLFAATQSPSNQSEAPEPSFGPENEPDAPKGTESPGTAGMENDAPEGEGVGDDGRDGRIKRFFAIAHGAGLHGDSAVKWLQDNWQVSSPKRLSWKKSAKASYDAVCGMLEGMKKK